MVERQQSNSPFKQTPMSFGLGTETDFRKNISGSRHSTSLGRPVPLGGGTEIRRYKPKPLVPICYSHTNKQDFAMQDYVGKIGWAMQNRLLAQSPKRVVLDESPHKASFDRGHCNTFVKNTGFFSSHVDTKYGIDLQAFQTLDIRTLRQLVKQRVWNQ